MSYYHPQDHGSPQAPEPDAHPSRFFAPQQQSIHPQQLHAGQDHANFGLQPLDGIPLLESCGLFPAQIGQPNHASRRLEDIFAEIHALLNEVQSISVNAAPAESNVIENRYREVIHKVRHLVGECDQQHGLQLAASLDNISADFDMAGQYVSFTASDSV